MVYFIVIDGSLWEYVKRMGKEGKGGEDLVVIRMCCIIE